MIVYFLLGYLFIGVVFCNWFLLQYWKKRDENFLKSSMGFRFIAILPTVFLWPFILLKLIYTK